MQHLSHATQLGRLCARLVAAEVSALHLAIGRHRPCRLSLVAAAVARRPVLHRLNCRQEVHAINQDLSVHTSEGGGGEERGDGEKG